MAHVKLSDVSVNFPVYDVKARSLKNRIMSYATGGLLKNEVGDQYTVNALRAINLELVVGDRIGVVGHNGAGKSTLLRLLNKIYVPTSGVADIFGKSSSLIDITLGIDLDATGVENIYIRAALLGLDTGFIKENFQKICDFSELGDYIYLPVRTYSSGMHMRLAFAVATLVQPEILIMDEWLSIGDSSFQRKAECRLNQLINNTEIMVIASHSIDLLKETCNKIVWLNHGEIVDVGTPGRVLARAFAS